MGQSGSDSLNFFTGEGARQVAFDPFGVMSMSPGPADGTPASHRRK
jgi:hypothetical protein